MPAERRTSGMKAVYIISVAAELAGVHPQTLRTYERKGLIKPARTAGGTRRYSAKDVDRVRLIQELTQGDGVNLAGVLRILAMQDEIDRLNDEVARAHREVDAVKAEARRLVSDAVRRTSTELVLYRPSAIEPHPLASRRRSS
jgi:MerR family transcriptional regulator/heat shock protein HspR